MEKNESKTPIKKSTTTSSAKKTTEKSTSTIKVGSSATSKTVANNKTSTGSSSPGKPMASKSTNNTIPTKPINSTKATSSAKPTASTNIKPAVTNTKTNLVKPSTPNKPTTSSANKSPVLNPTQSAKTKPTTSSSKPGKGIPATISKKVNNEKPKVSEIEQDELDKNLIAEDNEEEKKKKKKFILIIFFIILGLALLGVGIYFITTIPESEINFKVEVNADVETTYEDEFGQIQKILYFPGDIIKGQLKISVDDLNSTIPTSDSVYLRFKIDAYVDNNYYPGLFQPIFSKPSDWYGNGADDGMSSSSSLVNLEYSPDNYYYYCSKCYDNTEIDVFEYLNFIAEANNNVLNGKTGKLVFTVEILQGNFDAIAQEWYTAPDAWRNMENINK